MKNGFIMMVALMSHLVIVFRSASVSKLPDADQKPFTNHSG